MFLFEMNIAALGKTLLSLLQNEHRKDKIQLAGQFQYVNSLWLE